MSATAMRRALGPSLRSVAAETLRRNDCIHLRSKRVWVRSATIVRSELMEGMPLHVSVRCSDGRTRTFSLDTLLYVERARA